MWSLAESTLVAAVFFGGILLASRLGEGASPSAPDRCQPGPDRLHIYYQEN
jgi:hypothetical protein